ncbi:hypothetical protein [Joostella sp. CR20]|uniref:hypothetical protein n=1 Tax=Joostella sp. CR20 TaxID=2804312 RepID=UPI00313A8205
MKKLLVKLCIAIAFVIGVTDTGFTLFNKNKKQFNINKYSVSTEFSTEVIPEGYAEIKTDSTLSNKFMVSTKFHSVDETILKVEKPNAGAIHKTVYKDFHSDVFVYFEDKLIFKQRIEKDSFPTEDNTALAASYMQAFQLNEVASTENQIVFSVSFHNPSEEKYLDYEFIVDKIGDYYIKKV